MSTALWPVNMLPFFTLMPSKAGPLGLALVRLQLPRESQIQELQTVPNQIKPSSILTRKIHTRATMKPSGDWRSSWWKSCFLS